MKFRDIMDYKMIYKNNPEGLGILLHSGEALGATHRVTGAGSHYHLAIQLIWVGQGGRPGCVVPNFPYFYFVLMRFKYGIGKPKAMGKTWFYIKMKGNTKQQGLVKIMIKNTAIVFKLKAFWKVSENVLETDLLLIFSNYILSMHCVFVCVWARVGSKNNL